MFFSVYCAVFFSVSLLDLVGGYNVLVAAMHMQRDHWRNNRTPRGREREGGRETAEVTRLRSLFPCGRGLPYWHIVFDAEDACVCLLLHVNAYSSLFVPTDRYLSGIPKALLK